MTETHAGEERIASPGVDGQRVEYRLRVIDIGIERAQRLAAGPLGSDGLAPSELPDVVDEVVRTGTVFAEHPTTVSAMRRLRPARDAQVWGAM